MQAFGVVTNHSREEVKPAGRQAGLGVTLRMSESGRRRSWTRVNVEPSIQIADPIFWSWREKDVSSEK